MDLSGAVTLFLAICICFIFLLSWRRKNTCNNLPPGPYPFPFIGNALQLSGGEVVQILQRLSKTYGPVFTVYMGSRRVVVLWGYEAVKEALVDQAEEFSGRGKLPSNDGVFQGCGIIFSNGEHWKQLRRFSLMTLRNFGMGKRSIEKRIKEEVQCLLEVLRNSKEMPFDPTSILSQAVSNVICSITFGKRFDYEDEKFHKLLHMMNETFIHMSSFWGQLQDVLPNVMRYIPGPHHNVQKLLENLLQFISERVKISQESLDASFPGDFIECFLIKMDQEKGNPESYFNTKNLLTTVLNLFFAGTETVSTTLRFAFLLLLKHPEITEKLHKEIDCTIGRDRFPNAEDRSKMPFTEAVIHEIQRIANVIPMNVPHSVTKDTQFRGHLIPKGTDVFPVLWSVLQDPSQFSDPAEFNPQHFLDEKGWFKKRDAFMPFSAGKRICLGDGLARMELFLFLTSILQNFRLNSPVAPKEIDVSPKATGFANVPRSYQLSFIAR
ncbi:cytochrome P450 2G1-like isoform X2 [Lissotriton helveticus]